MFTGIIETIGTITHIDKEPNLYHFTLYSAFSQELKIDQSVSHNGVCLTVSGIKDNTYTVTAVQETLIKTNLGTWNIGDSINLERAMKMNDRLDGHIVQGHVDSTAICTDINEVEGQRIFTFTFDNKFAPLVIEKGSVCVNGISLTAFNVTPNGFSVTIIPYTFTHTNLFRLKVSDSVNIEFDILGKYIQRNLALQTS